MDIILLIKKKRDTGIDVEPRPHISLEKKNFEKVVERIKVVHY